MPDMSKKYGKASIFLNEWIAWCDERSEVPISLDQSYVIDYDYELSKNV